jgi:hypothetical protein
MHGSAFLDSAGEVIRPALLWSDQRTENDCATITERVGPRALAGARRQPRGNRLPGAEDPRAGGRDRRAGQSRRSAAGSAPLSTRRTTSGSSTPGRSKCAPRRGEESIEHLSLVGDADARHRDGALHPRRGGLASSQASVGVHSTRGAISSEGHGNMSRWRQLVARRKSRAQSLVREAMAKPTLPERARRTVVSGHGPPVRPSDRGLARTTTVRPRKRADLPSVAALVRETFQGRAAPRGFTCSS